MRTLLISLACVILVGCAGMNVTERDPQTNSTRVNRDIKDGVAWFIENGIVGAIDKSLLR